MALRRPVLATCVAGIPALVQHGENGWLCAPSDVDALAAALEDLLSRPAAELQAMGEVGHAGVIERHSVDASAARLAGLFAA
jgi:glycosyltransferase involved in cell wall biosynthesis